MFDCHIHTKNSHDSTQTLSQVCESAIAMGMKGIAICDHVDLCSAERHDTYHAMQRCIAEVKEARLQYGDRLRILQGMELAGVEFNPSMRDPFMQLCDYDVILGSVHTVYLEDVDDSYSRVDWSVGEKSMERIRAFFAAYLKSMREMLARDDIDVLSHLTCPLRYINGKYRRGLDEREFYEEIDEILREIIRREIALEVNTSGAGRSYGDWLPSRAILTRYYELGGRMLTLGSDAHIPESIGNAFEEACEMLREIGFREICYFAERKPIFIGLEEK